MVWVYRKKPAKFYQTKPGKIVADTSHAWDHGTEHGFMKQREDAMQGELGSILDTGVVRDHEVISRYVALWRTRAHVGSAPSVPMSLVGVTPSQYTQDELDCLEKSGTAVYGRDGIPGHFVGGRRVRVYADKIAADLTDVRWSFVALADGAGEFIVPDCPSNALWFPISPTVLLQPVPHGAAFFPAMVGSEETSREANAEAIQSAMKWVFARSRDAIETALARTER